MIPIDEAIRQLQLLKEHGATHVEGDRDGSGDIDAYCPDEERVTFHPLLIGYADEEGGILYVKKDENDTKRLRAVPLT